MSKKSKKTNNVENSLADVVSSTPGIGGGINPIGFPMNQGFPGTAQVENATTIFKNLRWYLVSNFRQMLCEAYVEIGLVQTICDVPVDDALRGGVTIKSDQLGEEELIELKSSLDRDNDLVTAGQAAKWNRLFGGAGVIILTDQDPEEPLDIESIDEDTPLEFRAVDMWELFHDAQGADGYNPTVQSETFEYYNYYGERIHKTRVMKMEGLVAPSFIRPRLRGWGFSVVEILVRSINQYLKATDLTFEVLDEFKIDVFKIKNLSQALMSPDGTELIKRRVQLANYQKNYQNALTMDTEDDWDHKQLSFTGIAEAMLQIRMQVASDMRMPMTKLFGISASGFNSGEDDIEVYNAMVESQVRNKIKYLILRMIEIKCKKMFGYIPDDLSIEFEPLRVMSSEQEETVKDKKFSRLAQALQSGAITLEEFRDGCNKSQLFDITLEKDPGLEEGYLADQIEGGDGDDVDVDNPGESRDYSEKPTAKSAGGIPKGNVKPKNGNSKSEKKGNDKKGKAKPIKNSPVVVYANSDFDESKVKRDEEGKFSEMVGGGGKGAKGSIPVAVPKGKDTGKGEPKPIKSGDKVSGMEVRDEVPNMGSIEASLGDYEVLEGVREISMDHFTYSPPYSKSEMDRTRKLAEEIKVSMSISPLIVVQDNEGYYVLEGGHRFDALNMNGAKSFPAIIVKDLDSLNEKTENSILVMPQPYTDGQLVKRKLLNSAAFDRKAYEAHGGDNWIDPGRELFFTNPSIGDVNLSLWRRAEVASIEALGELRWQFVVWWYQKQGGKFTFNRKVRK